MSYFRLTIKNYLISFNQDIKRVGRSSRWIFRSKT